MYMKFGPSQICKRLPINNLLDLLSREIKFGYSDSGSSTEVNLLIMIVDPISSYINYFLSDPLRIFSLKSNYVNIINKNLLKKYLCEILLVTVNNRDTYKKSGQ